MKSIPEYVKYAKPYKKYIIIGPLFKLSEAILELLMPLILANVIDKGIMTGDTNYVLKMSFVLIGIVAISLGAATVCQYVASIASQGYGTELRHAVFTHISKLSHRELNSFGTASLVNRVTNDINQLQHGLAMLIRLMVRAPFLSIGGFVMAMFINFKLSLIVLITLPILSGIIYFIMKNMIHMYKRVQLKVDELLLVLHENLTGVRVIRSFARSREEERRFGVISDEQMKIATDVGMMSALLNPITQLVMNIALIAVLWYGGMLVDSGEMTAGKMIALINYIGQILVALLAFAKLIIIFTKAFASGRRVDEVLLTEPSLISGSESIVDRKSMNSISFNNVDFSYEEGDSDLSNMNFEIPAGASVGIIGGTGSGKSTIINLIMRLYDVNNGSVKLFNRDVRDYELHTLRDLVALVPQRVELFSGTIRENIAWGKMDATDEEIELAAELAQASSFIEIMPNGYDSKVEQGGTNFSGGQRQRIAIARALVKPSQILILDDSSSALDYATGRALRDSIESLDNGQTVIMVSQRVSEIMEMEDIMVMDDGELVGFGTHEELIVNCPKYIEICKSQDIDIEEEIR